MNKVQKRELVRAKRLQQTKNRELGRAMNLVWQTNANDIDMIEACRKTSIRVLRYLTKEDVELPEGLFVANPLREAAKNEIFERQVLRAK